MKTEWDNTCRVLSTVKAQLMNYQKRLMSLFLFLAVFFSHSLCAPWEIFTCFIVSNTANILMTPKFHSGLPSWLSGKKKKKKKNLPANAGGTDWSLGWKEPLEKEMAPPSSVLAWTIPWTEEPGGLQSMGSKRVGQGLAVSRAIQRVDQLWDKEFGQNDSYQHTITSFLEKVFLLKNQLN